jgi:hypothetical protein
MRLSVTKKQHQQLLLEVASQLRSSDPKDALEHVLNWWISQCHPQPVTVAADAQPVAIAASPTASPDGDLDLEGLASWD